MVTNESGSRQSKKEKRRNAELRPGASVTKSEGGEADVGQCTGALPKLAHTA